MNYKVLYRKYRPSNFDGVVGQKNTIELLKDSVLNNKISHAYIFSGPRGTGKTSTAKIFAKAINCSCLGEEKPCGKCKNCLDFSESNDIYEIDAASNNGVDQIREIVDNIKLTPIYSKYKIYIIDEVHMLSDSAFNALLLTLEEPPSHVVFILATTNIEDVPITVLSRCQRMDFKKISNKDIINTLKDISIKENILIDDAAIEEIAEFSDGGLRDALSMLDQLSKSNDNITQEIVLNSIGLISNQAIVELLDSIEENKPESIIQFVEKVRENCYDYKTIVKKIIELTKKRAINIKLGIESSRLTYKQLRNICIELSNSLYKSNVHIDSYSILELILLEYTFNANTESVDNDKDDIPTFDEIVSKKNNQNSSIKAQNSTNKKDLRLIDIRMNNCFVNANKTYLSLCKADWKKFIDDIEDKKIKGILMDTEIVLASNEIFVIKTNYEENVAALNENIEKLMDDYNKFIKKEYKIVAISNNRWDEEMELYKQNITKKKKYIYIEENENIEDNIGVEDIFKSKRVEVK